MSAVNILAIVLSSWAATSSAEDRFEVQARVISIPTPLPSGVARNDRIWINLYAPRNAPAGRLPAAILLHPLGDSRYSIMFPFGRYLAERGVIAAVVELPYHMRRFTRGMLPLSRYVSSDIEQAHQAFAQAIADSRAVTDWLAAQPGIDAGRIGIVGVSLGAIVAHVVMGQDARVAVGVAMLGGADFPDLYRRSILFRLLHPGHTRPLTEQEASLLREIDPLTYAERNRPRRVLMIQAARDDIIPASNATRLWNALGRPPIRWVDTNHYGPSLTPETLMETSLEFLRTEWGLPRLQRVRQPLYAPPVKVAVLGGLDVPASLALEWQAISFLQRPNHMSLLHFDLGFDVRGPYFGFAATANAYMDVGYGRRFGRAQWRPYISLHVTL